MVLSMLKYFESNTFNVLPKNAFPSLILCNFQLFCLIMLCIFIITSPFQNKYKTLRSVMKYKFLNIDIFPLVDCSYEIAFSPCCSSSYCINTSNKVIDYFTFVLEFTSCFLGKEFNACSIANVYFHGNFRKQRKRAF